MRLSVEWIEKDTGGWVRVERHVRAPQKRKVQKMATHENSVGTDSYVRRMILHSWQRQPPRWESTDGSTSASPV
jgi:hypothetical protein